MPQHVFSAHSSLTQSINYYVLYIDITQRSYWHCKWKILILILFKFVIVFSFCFFHHSFCFVFISSSSLLFRLPFVFHHCVFIKFSMVGNRNTDQQTTKHYEADFQTISFQRARHRNECVKQIIICNVHSSLKSMAKFKHQICVKLSWKRSNTYWTQLLLLCSSFLMPESNTFSTPQWFATSDHSK